MVKKIICALVIFTLILPAFCIPISAEDLPFTDVSPTTWQYRPIRKVFDLGIMNGVSKNRFEPNKKLTRAEAAMILYNIGGRGVSYSKYSFKDVKAGAWYADAVEWMYKKGITKGVSKDRFGVSEYITRQDFITFIYRMYEDDWNLTSKNKDIYIRESAINNFRDRDSISPYAFSAMRFSAGICMVVTHDPAPMHYNVSPIITGHNGLINPRGNCTRVEAAVVIGNAYTIDTYL